jgi:uncharacterized membrane protein YcjF (UPF0283 family)
MLATSYPLLDVFWTMLEFFAFFLWIWLIIIILSDIFRSRDLSGWGKALWVIAIIVIPFFGILLYLIVRGGKMHERALEQAQAQDAAFRSYVQETAASSATGSADQLAALADLRERGVLSEAEFQQEKAKVLAS